MSRPLSKIGFNGAVAVVVVVVVVAVVIVVEVVVVVDVVVVDVVVVDVTQRGLQVDVDVRLGDDGQRLKTWEN